MGDKLAANIIAAIDGSKNPPLARLIYALGIRLIGEHAADLLARTLGSLETLQTATVEQLAAIHDIGQTTAESIAAFFALPETTLLLDKLRKAGIRAQPVTVAPVADTLAGKSFVFTGRAVHAARAARSPSADLGRARVVVRVRQDPLRRRRGQCGQQAGQSAYFGRPHPHRSRVPRSDVFVR